MNHINIAKHISQQKKKELKILLCLMIVSSAVELVSIASILPLLKIMSDPESLMLLIEQYKLEEYVKNIRQYDIIQLLAGTFILLTAVSLIIKILVLKRTTKLSYSIGHELSVKIFNKVMKLNYEELIKNDTSVIIDGISTKTHGVINGTILPLLLLMNAVVISLGLISLIIALTGYIVLYMAFAITAFYLVILKISKARTDENSKVIATQSKKLIKIIQESLGSFRDLVLNNYQDMAAQAFKNEDEKLRNSQSSTQYIAQAPKIYLESFVLILMISVALIIQSQTSALQVVIPILGLIMLSAQKLIPQINQIYSSVISIKSWNQSVHDTLNLLDGYEEITANKSVKNPIKLNKEIKLENVTFGYSEHEKIFDRITLKIEKGSRVGIVGKSGEGKSTLVDLLASLLHPREGAVTIDGVPLNEINSANWREMVSYVHQGIYIINSTIAENIAFGVPANDIDKERLNKVIEDAAMGDFIKNLPQKTQTLVGDGGVKLSGGQQQRIGIARALYKNANVIIFDEATSALDAITEGEIIKTIENLGSEITVLIISHRMELLTKCDAVFEIKNKKIRNVLMEQSTSTPN